MVPFANFKDFQSCQKSAAKKGIKNTGAYCGAIEANVRGTRKKYVLKKEKEGKNMVENTSEYIKRASKKTVKTAPMYSSKSKDIVNTAMAGAAHMGLSGIMGESEYNMFGKKQRRK